MYSPLVALSHVNFGLISESDVCLLDLMEAFFGFYIQFDPKYHKSNWVLHPIIIFYVMIEIEYGVYESGFHAMYGGAELKRQQLHSYGSMPSAPAMLTTEGVVEMIRLAQYTLSFLRAHHSTPFSSGGVSTMLSIMPSSKREARK